MRLETSSTWRADGRALHRAVAIGMALALALGTVWAAPASAAEPWTHVGSGPMAASRQLSTEVPFPENIEAGDLLLLTCQGRRNAMAWSAPDFTKARDFTDPPWGPPGLRFELQYKWATGIESGTHLVVRNTTGINGWSCVLTAFRGGSGSGQPIDRLGGTWTPSGERAMHGDPYNWAPEGLDGALVVHWFVSRDDNNHGRPSHGTLGYGGPAYDTTIGTDHAVSMLYHVGAIPEAGDHITMRQLSRGPDAYASMSVVIP